MFGPKARSVTSRQGLRPLGSGEVQSGGNKTPGLIVPLAVVAATANPIGLIVGGAAKAYGQVSGSDTIEGMGKRTAKTIADELRGGVSEAGLDLAGREHPDRRAAF